MAVKKTPSLKSLRAWYHLKKSSMNNDDTPPPRLAIFKRHSLLDGRPAAYVSSPGSAMGHPFLGDAPFNVGDNFVSMALARALDVREFLVLTHAAPQACYDYVNEHCEALIVVSQNSLRPGFFGKFLPRRFVEKKIKIPMIFVSLGVQFELDETPHLTDDDVDSLKCIHDKCASSQLRGAISADLLAKHGITNTRVLGCPSILWDLTRDLKVKAPSYDRVGWTLTEMGGDRAALQEQQQSLMNALAQRADTFVPIAQGGEYVLQEYITMRDGLAVGERKDTVIEFDAD
ncbi:MAG: polysaccharide pyruvyl transferase family protein, partial [Pseudomonadota bacterium]